MKNFRLDKYLEACADLGCGTFVIFGFVFIIYFILKPLGVWIWGWFHPYALITFEVIALYGVFGFWLYYRRDLKKAWEKSEGESP